MGKPASADAHRCPTSTSGRNRLSQCRDHVGLARLTRRPAHDATVGVQDQDRRRAGDVQLLGEVEVLVHIEVEMLDPGTICATSCRMRRVARQGAQKADVNCTSVACSPSSSPVGRRSTGHRPFGGCAADRWRPGATHRIRPAARRSRGESTHRTCCAKHLPYRGHSHCAVYPGRTHPRWNA